MLAVITRALFPAAIKGKISLVCELFAAIIAQLRSKR